MKIRFIAVAFSLAVSTTALLAQDSPASETPAQPVTVAPTTEMSAATEPVTPAESTAPADAATVAPADAAATVPADGTATTTAVDPAAASTETGAVTGGKTKETLSVDFPNAEIRTILRNIADLFDLNLVIPETLEGRASLKLRDVTWKQIFDVLLTPVGYTYISDGNIIKVVSIESLNVEPAETRIFILNYARAGEIAPTLNSMIDAAKGGKLQVDTRSNALVVTERPKRLEKIDEVIKRLDRATAQVLIETKFVEVTNRDLRDLGVNWASLRGYQMNLDPTPTLVRGSGHNFVRNGDDELIEESRESSAAFGAVFDATEFQAILSALETQSETKLISNPTVVTMNNNEAIISIGEQFPVPNYTYNQERGTFEVSGFEYKDIGIILRVTPQVNNAGLITLKIDPEVSSRTDTTSFGGGGGSTAEIPIIAIRRTSTQVALKDGFTMGLGGLIENTTTNGTSKVPLLGDIPGIGQLFRSKSKDVNRRNLIVFITAKVLSPDGADYHDVFSPELMQEMSLTEADVPAGHGMR